MEGSVIQAKVFNSILCRDSESRCINFEIKYSKWENAKTVYFGANLPGFNLDFAVLSSCVIFSKSHDSLWASIVVTTYKLDVSIKSVITIKRRMVPATS